MLTIWHGLGPETQAALIGALSTLAVAIVGFGGLILQMRAQARQGREAIAENERRKLKAAMYDEAVAVCRVLADAAIDLSTQLRTMAFELAVAAQAASVDVGYQTPSTRFPALLAGYAAFSDAVFRFIFLVENRRFVDPRIVVFRTALSVVIHDTGELMHRRFPLEVMPTLPTEAPAGNLYPYTPPAPASAERVRVLAETFIQSLTDATSYTEDFLVELQNRLLGDLFETSVAHREPIDPAVKVITLEDAEDLERWFATSTAWGQKYARIEAETRS